jgi:suppressor of ftsI
LNCLRPPLLAFFAVTPYWRIGCFDRQEEFSKIRPQGAHSGTQFAPDASPMTSVRAGTYQHWRIFNATAELHPFHIHQVHFLAYAENGVPISHPAWLDTVNVPYRGSVDVILDFTDPVIKGMSVFHCHLLNHEDKGMMAKILFK